MVGVSIIIVNYNTLQLTRDCINSIYEKTKDVSFEVILVDNNSTDGSVEFFRKDERIVFISSQINLGFGRANNKGLEKANGKYVFFLNSDTLLGNNAVKLFYDKMEECQHSIACMGTLLFDSSGKIIHSYGKLPTKMFILTYYTSIGPILRMLGYKTRYYDYPHDMKGHFFPVGYITGADLFVRKSVIDRFGAFDPDFFMYYEDSEMQKRYKENGFFSYVYDLPKIYHLVSASSKKKSNLFRKAMSLNGCFLYQKKHSSTFTYYLFRFMFAIMEIPVLFYPKDSFKNKLIYFKKIFDVSTPKNTISL